MQWTIRLLDCHGAAYSVSAAEPWPQEARKVRQNTVWQADGEGAQGMWDHGCRDSMLHGTHTHTLAALTPDACSVVSYAYTYVLIS